MIPSLEVLYGSTGLAILSRVARVFLPEELPGLIRVPLRDIRPVMLDGADLVL